MNNYLIRVTLFTSSLLLASATPAFANRAKSELINRMIFKIINNFPSFIILFLIFMGVSYSSTRDIEKSLEITGGLMMLVLLVVSCTV